MPELTFPPGVGGLETLRLVCTFAGALPPDQGKHALSVTDGSDDERSGWREVTIGAEAEVILTESDVSSVSPSALLTTYPEDLLQAPIDVASGSATYRSASTAGGPAVAPDGGATPGDGSTGGRPMHWWTCSMAAQLRGHGCWPSRWPRGSVPLTLSRRAMARR